MLLDIAKIILAMALGVSFMGAGFDMGGYLTAAEAHYFVIVPLVAVPLLVGVLVFLMALVRAFEMIEEHLKKGRRDG